MYKQVDHKFRSQCAKTSPGRIVQVNYEVGHSSRTSPNRRWPKHHPYLEPRIASSKADSDLMAYSLTSGFTERIDPRTIQDWQVPKTDVNRNIIGFGLFIRKYDILS